MNNLILKTFTALTTFTLSATSLSAQNPICPTGTYIPDPSARVLPDGKLYVYGSLDIDSKHYCSDHYHVMSSKDVKKWDVCRDAFKWETTLYAPDLIHKDGKYYLYYDIPDGTEYVARSDSPVGPFLNAEKIEGPRQIDPCIFIDDDGQAYYFWGQMSAKGARMNPDMKTLDMSSYVDGVVTEKEHGFHEGSFIFKRNGWYYFVYADISRRGRPTCLGYSMSRSPLGPYIYKGIIIDNYGCDPGVWNNHGSVVEFKGKWYVLYHRSTHGCEYMRRACMEPIEFAGDGTIPEVEMTSQGAGKALDARKVIEAERACLLGGNCRIRLIENCSDNEEIAEIQSGDSATWKYLDFKSGCRSAELKIKAPAGCQVKIYADGESVGELMAPASEQWARVTGNISKISGRRAITLKFECPAPCSLDCITFK